MYFAIASHIFVPDPKQSASFLAECLGFRTQYKDGQGWLAENGTVSLLIHASEQPQASLEIQCNHLEHDSQALLKHAAVHAVSDIEKHPRRLEQRLISDCGISLILSQMLTEDDLNELPDLPTSLPWDEQTMQHVQRILRIVPLDFRDKARQQSTERAEYLAVEQGDLMVNESYAMQALVDVTLKFQHPTLYQAMRDEGIASEVYERPCGN
ncbi:MAG: hypothetical protein Q9M18_06205 [Mariprofundaceae bacterium]|nr:hypothetical protein [Mariprofundaceae bacterium]